MNNYFLKSERKFCIAADWLSSILYYVADSLEYDPRYPGKFKRNIIIIYFIPVLPIWILLSYLEQHHSFDEIQIYKTRKKLLLTCIIIPTIIYSIKWLIFRRNKNMTGNETAFYERNTNV